MIARLAAFGRRWLSDAHVQQHQPEMRIAIAQAIFIGAPIVATAIGLWAILP